MKQPPTIRKKLITLPDLPNGGTPVRFDRDLELERAHIVGMRLLTFETVPRVLLDPKAAPVIAYADVRYVKFLFVDRFLENVVDYAPAMMFVLTAIAPRQARENFVPVDWRGLSLHLSHATLDTIALPRTVTLAVEVYYLQKDDL